MERENGGNDFSFLARIESQSRNQYRKDIAPEYDAVARYLEEPLTYQHRRTGVEREYFSAQALSPSFIILDEQRQYQQQYWRAPDVDGLFAGIGSWADESSIEKGSKL